MFFTNMELHPQKKKKNYVFEANAIGFGHCCVAFMFPFLSCCNQPILSASCPETPKPQRPRSSPWIPMFHHQGAIRTTWVRKKWQIVKRLLIGSLLGRCHLPFFLQFPVVSYDAMERPNTFWQEKWPARPSTKKISCKHKSQAKKKFGSGCSGLDAEI